MSKFKVGDRVRSIISGRCGQVVPFSRKYVEVAWNDGNHGITFADNMELAEGLIPDGLVVDFECRSYEYDRGLYRITGIAPERLNGKFRLVPVE